MIVLNSLPFCGNLTFLDYIRKQFGPRLGSGSKLFSTLVVFLKEFFEKVKFEKSQQMTTKA